MMHRNKKIHDFFFNEDYEVQHKLLNYIVLIGIAGMFAGLVVQLLMDFKIRPVLIMGCAIVFFIFTIFIADFLHRPQLAIVFLAITTNNILLPEIFILSGGLHSGKPVWCIAGCILMFFLLKGKKAYIIFAINIMGFVITAIHAYYYPYIVNEHASEQNVVTDIIISVCVVTMLLSSVLKYFTTFYEKQKNKAEKAMEIANKADKSKSDFLSMMSHDIRTPMNTIIGFTEIARKNSSNPQKLEECLNRITIASNHLLRLVDDVLDVRKIESGNLARNEENCSLKSIIADVCEMMQASCNEKNIIIETNFNMLEDDNISCNRLRLNQILINLLNNAVKYSHKDGKIFISVIQFTSDDESKIICEFHIRDEGCGMSTEFLTHVFEPFQREQTEYNKNLQGSGLGLSITKSLVQMMGGTIEVMSELDKGTEFIITIPFSIPSLTDLEEDEDMSVLNLNNFRVLLVDDNDEHREIIVNTLSEVGAQVDETSEGQLAIKKLKAQKAGYYDLVLMDIVMPVMDGYEATREIRKLSNEKLANIPIVAMTANAYADDKAKAFEAGMNAYITKPIETKEFLKVIKLILN